MNNKDFRSAMDGISLSDGDAQKMLGSIKAKYAKKSVKLKTQRTLIIAASILLAVTATAIAVPYMIKDGSGVPSATTELSGEEPVETPSDEEGYLTKLSHVVNISLVGEELTDDEAQVYFSENSASIISGLSASGVSTKDFSVSKSGVCHLRYDGNGYTIAQNFRDYYAYSGDSLVSIITLIKENGKISASPSFGAEWFDEYNDYLNAHEGQKLLYVYAGTMEAVITENNEISNPMGYQISYAFSELEDAYAQLYNDKIVYIP